MHFALLSALVVLEGTHAFLPKRNGITPKTLHIIFDLLTIGTLIVLAHSQFRAGSATRVRLESFEVREVSRASS